MLEKNQNALELCGLTSKAVVKLGNAHTSLQNIWPVFVQYITL